MDHDERFGFGQANKLGRLVQFVTTKNGVCVWFDSHPYEKKIKELIWSRKQEFLHF